MDCEYLKSLNPAQLKAVRHPPDIPIQILAGPGSGKTKVLTSRIAYLILHHNLPPSSICAVTFTNKAAAEMRERLTKLIGKSRTAEVRMGTFHSLCTRFLRMYSTTIGLAGNFTVCDAEDSKKLISKLLAPYKEDLIAKDINLLDVTVLSIISKAKAKGCRPDELLPQSTGVIRNENASGMNATTQQGDIANIISKIYSDYEKSLRQSNSLDFDDLLLFGVKLFSQHKRAVQWCKHVLVDEFQDTNVMQYELMRYIAAANHCVTIVGDPDQSIYGWRSAEVENLGKMRKDFPKTEQILLEQNYRSTGAILKASITIVSQDKSRIQKTLQASFPNGPCPVLLSFVSEHEEAALLATEIKRLVANMGGVLKWGDFVVLLRFNALSRALEAALQKEAIPNRVLGGHKFFERLEVKDLLAYLHCVDNPEFTPAFSRAINVPARGIGEKTLREISSRAEKINVSPMEVVEKIHDSTIPDIKPPIKRKLYSFVQTVRELRRLANKQTSPADLIRRLVVLTSYEDHLRSTQPDWESRWENVKELINFASEVQLDMNEPNNTPIDFAENEIMTLKKGDVTEQSIEPGSTSVPLRNFLQTLTLSSEGDNDTEEKDNEKVTISTCHAAKGLEWPVVMIPAVEKGTFPFYRAEDIEEERRLLYVACTRAQGLLYISHSTKRKVAGIMKSKELSEFISPIVKENPELFSSRIPEFSTADRALISRVLNRPEPQAAEVSKRIIEFNRTTRPQIPVPQIKPKFIHPSNAQQARPISIIAQPKLSTTSQPKPSPTYTPLAPTRPPLVTLPMSTSVDSVVPKKRLGMGRATVGYSNKKFKPPEA